MNNAEYRCGSKKRLVGQAAALSITYWPGRNTTRAIILLDSGKTRLGLADYQMQGFEAIEKFYAIVFLALAYLQYRLVQSLAAAHQTGLARSNDQLRTLADVIRLHRAEHDVQLLKVACQLALQHNSLAPVLAKFLRPFSAITSHLEITM